MTTTHSLSFPDQTGRTVHLEKLPERIISIVPSQTELLYDLGLGEQIAGITKFCVHPTEIFRSKPRVGGTKNISLEKISILNPDLIIANKEENNKEQVEELMKHFPVWISDIRNLDDATSMIRSIGDITNKNKEAEKIIDTIEKQFSILSGTVTGAKAEKRVAYLIWKKPWMTVNHTTFIHHLLERCRLTNVFGKHKNRYPEISEEELAQSGANLIFLSSEPYPFRDKHIAEIKTICHGPSVHLVDGEFFSWYGSRLQYAPEYFLSLMRNTYF